MYCQSLFINVYEQYYLLSVTIHQCIGAVLPTVGYSSSMYPGIWLIPTLGHGICTQKSTFMPQYLE